MEPIFKGWIRDVLNTTVGNTNTPAITKDQFLTIKEAATLLKLAVPTIYSMVSRRAIPYMKRSQRLYFSRDELTKWLIDGKRSTIEEIKVDALKSLER
jgi:excisionase family DNA binding protein